MKQEKVGYHFARPESFPEVLTLHLFPREASVPVCKQRVNWFYLAHTCNASYLPTYLPTYLPKRYPTVAVDVTFALQFFVCLLCLMCHKYIGYFCVWINLMGLGGMSVWGWQVCEKVGLAHVLKCGGGTQRSKIWDFVEAQISTAFATSNYIKFRLPQLTNLVSSSVSSTISHAHHKCGTIWRNNTRILNQFLV